ncbi:phosphonates import ATP-binding protein like protein [Tanacetum coccineum]
MVAFTSEELSMIATILGKPIMLDFYMSFMCMESFGRGSFARALIELDATCGLKDMLVVAIPKSEGSCYRMETIRVAYECKPPRCNECKIFGHSCEYCPKKTSTSDSQLKAGKQKDVRDDGFQSVKRKTSKCGNWESQGKSQGNEFIHSLLKQQMPKSAYQKKTTSTPVFNVFSALVEDNENHMDDLVDDTRKKVEAPLKNTPRKTGF